ncbi:MAG: hypothetical protein UV45_C0035G0004 [Candidatus Azambacteria bacterium GW2011_GWB1_42_72]|nr:MAG: hypothetical protein UV45_C0035G0004 [Candidatus Azambacteria bacterium GW2011_GWB1_42_72]
MRPHNLGQREAFRLEVGEGEYHEIQRTEFRAG